MKYKDKIVVQAYVPLSIYDKLKVEADKQKRPLSSYLRIVLEDYVENNLTSGTSNEDIQRINK